MLYYALCKIIAMLHNVECPLHSTGKPLHKQHFSAFPLHCVWACLGACMYVWQTKKKCDWNINFVSFIINTAHSLSHPSAAVCPCLLVSYTRPPPFAHSCPLNNAACQPDSLHHPKQCPRSATEGHMSQPLALRPSASTLLPYHVHSIAFYLSPSLPVSLTHTHWRCRCTKTRAVHCATRVASVVTDAVLSARRRADVARGFGASKFTGSEFVAGINVLIKSER